MIESQNRRPLTIKQLNVATGLSISTLRRRVKDGTIPVIQAGGRGKKLLFRATVIEELCAKRTDGAATEATDSESQCNETLSTSDDGTHAGQAGKATDASAQFGGITRPETGPIPNWMRSPLLNQYNSIKTNSKNNRCQDNARTN